MATCSTSLPLVALASSRFGCRNDDSVAVLCIEITFPVPVCYKDANLENQPESAFVTNQLCQGSPCLDREGDDCSLILGSIRAV